MITKVNFGKRISDLRIGRGQNSAREMSLALGQNPSYINRIENGKALPSMQGFFSICEYLQITPGDFFNEDTEAPREVRELLEKIEDYIQRKQYKELRALLLCLNPVSPHVTEEMWEICGFGEPIYTQSWPTYDENKLVADEVEIAVQIKGKVRGRIMVPASLGKDDGEKLLENETVKKLVGDAQVKKIIFVPGRLLNIVC